MESSLHLIATNNQGDALVVNAELEWREGESYLWMKDVHGNHWLSGTAAELERVFAGSLVQDHRGLEYRLGREEMAATRRWLVTQGAYPGEFTPPGRLSRPSLLAAV